ncbi:MAG: hypothetical protein WD403_03265 [Pirellulales bacterium]
MSGGLCAGPGLPKGTESDPRMTNGKRPHAAESQSKNGSSHGSTNGSSEKATALLERAGIAPKWEFDSAAGSPGRSEQFASFQADAPACDNCGAITVRNGNCYLCHNCGNSMGCS